MTDRYRVNDRPGRKIEPWRDAKAIEDMDDPTSGTDPAIIAWTTRGADTIPRTIVDALNRPGLIDPAPFLSHSGVDLAWKIDADALTDADLSALAKLVADRIAFRRVEGIPRGGLRFAAALEQYASADAPLEHQVLIVDDVLTTGKSMQAARDEMMKYDLWSTGVVIFARAVCPHWVRPIFSLSPWMQP